MATKPKLAMIPSGYKGQTATPPKLYSVLPADGTGDFTFDRNLNTATRINKDGLIEMVDADVPRLNYPLIDGVVSGCPSLLLEPARTNLITYSEDYNTWNKAALTNSSVTEVNPQGTTSTQKITQTSSGGFVWLPRTFTGNETFSVFVKKDSSNFARLYAANNSVYFDIVNGTITSEIGSEITDKSIIDYGNGWFRISISVNSTASNVRIYPASSGTSSNGTNSMFVLGAQLEVGSYPTSYIPTNGSTATRSAETCNRAGDAATFNDSEGVLMAEISALNDTVDGYTTINIGSNSVDNRLGFGFDDQSRIYGFKRTTTSWNTPIEANINEFNKVAISYNTNDNHFWLNGFKVDSNTTIGDITQPIELDFRASYGGEQFYGSAKQIQYFDTALNDTDLETLTSWTSFNEMAQAQLYKTY